MQAHQDGRAAERLVRDFLVERGLEPLVDNWRRRCGEIDLVMREPASDTIVFVEVRYRRHRALGGGLASIDHPKRARLRRAALAWLQRHGDPEQAARIDVVAVAPAASASRPDEAAPKVGSSIRTSWRSASLLDHDAGHEDIVVARRGERLLEWVISAIESDD